MKPSIPKGTRDFLPEEVRKRDYLFSVIKQYFKRFGYQPIETPVMENLSTLTGKYGDEGDRLLFKVLNNGDFLSKVNSEDLEAKDSQKVVSQLSKRGLRYDLTVPFARYVVMHRNELTFPFKRYALMPVWRADRPQKGRYQEFYQCDADVVGSDSLLYEAEFTHMIDQVFTELGIQVVIRLNNRKILAGLAEVAGMADQMIDMTVAIDKIDKIGQVGVEQELLNRGATEKAIQTILSCLACKKIEEVSQHLSTSAIGQEGIEELRQVFDMVPQSSLKNRLEFDISLARGLNYYTGCIFETVVDTEIHPEIRMGSILGGGRYADLTGIFGMKDTSGVGISFGAERIYDVMLELNLFPDEAGEDLRLLLLCLDDHSLREGFSLVTRLRKAGLNADIYPEASKVKKMMKYADQRGVPNVAIIGSQELSSGEYTVKNMKTGQQRKLVEAELIAL